MKIIKKGIVYRVNEGPFRYQAWPTVTQDENGVLYAACSGHRSSHVCTFGKDLMFTSTDGGETWEEDYILNDNINQEKQRDMGYPATVELPDGSLITVYYERYKDDKFTSIQCTKWTIEEFE